MDADKLRVLREIDYKIHPTCGRCTFGVFKRGTEWGSCSIHKYEHQKHSNQDRHLSINKSGSCPNFKPHEYEDLHGFKEFEDKNV